ncbi:MAG: hypothetical protein FWB88_04850 [Defluviitaleaceae bacterium]|nr:hypothetical protein [Defluviitaleaceae bacterium]MCL2238642.1 hypothetical protein [Defluviitaleaceae bacterium]
MWITNFTQKIETWATENSAVYKLSERYYRDIVEKEAALAHITREDHILCIGGGICPFSAILLHRHTGAKVTVIDNNKDCIPPARKMIQRLGLEDSVAVHCQDGAIFPAGIGEYTVIHFALQVCPMECVFSHMQSHAAPGTRFLLRAPRERLRNLYSPVAGKLRDILSRSPFAMHRNARNIKSTHLYIKACT